MNFLRLVAFACSLLLLASTALVRPDYSQDFDNRPELEKQVDTKLGASDTDGALALLAKAIDRGDHAADAYWMRAKIRRGQSDYQRALADLDRAIELKSNDFRFFSDRAILKRILHDDASALKDLDSAKLLRPDQPSIYSDIADISAKKKDYLGAIGILDEGLTKSPDSVNLAIEINEYFTEMGQPDKGLERLKTYLDDFTARHHGKLPKIRGERVKKKIPSEIKAFGTQAHPVVRYSQTSMDANSMADVMRQQNEMAQARSLAHGYYLLGKGYVGTGKHDDALAVLTTAADIDPNNEDVHVLKGAIFLTNGEATKAITEFDDAIDLADRPEFYLNRGIAYFLLNDEKRSQKDLGTFIKLYPDGQTTVVQRLADAKQFRSNPPAGVKIK